MRRLVLAALAAGVTLPANAQTTPSRQPSFAVEGGGRLTCADFEKARANKSSATYQRLIGFFEGYLTAANRYEPNTFDLSPWHNAAAFDLIVDGHCKAHAKDPLVNVAQRMVSGFRSIRVAKFSPMVEVGTGSGKTYIYQALIERSQAALASSGLYTGPRDGKYSEAMRAALAAFQTSKRLSPTGLPDPATLWLLLNP